MFQCVSAVPRNGLLLGPLCRLFILPFWFGLLLRNFGPGRGGGGSPDIKVVGVPAGNFHDKPCQFFYQSLFDPHKVPKFQPLKIPRFELTSHTQKRVKLPRIKEDNHLNVCVHDKIKQIQAFRN